MAELTTEENQESGDSFGQVTERESTVEEQAPETVKPTVAEAEESSEQATGETQETQPDGKEEDVKLTDKGTKLDPNPESAAHQLLANERAKARALESLLKDPEKLQEYMKETFPPKVEEVPAKTYVPEDFENLEDVANVVNKLQSDFAEARKGYEAKINNLEKNVNGLLTNGRYQQVASTMEKEIGGLRQEKELAPNNPEFIEGLEEDIAEMYHRLDFDEQTGAYQGKYSIADIGNRMISAARKARQKGSQDAQTVVKDKSAGKVVTSPKVKEEVAAETLSPADSIARGISNTFK